MIFLKLGLMFALLGFSAFFSGSETALFSLNAIKIRKMERRGKDTRLIQELLKNPHKLIVTILVGNTLVNIAISVVATSLFLEHFGNKGLGISIGITTLILLIFGEISPKTLAIEKCETVSLIIAGPLKIFSALIFPVRRALRLISERLIRIAKIGGKKEPTLTEEELKTIIDVGHKEGVVKRRERDMIRSVLEFTDTEVKDIMTPRVDIQAVSLDMEQDEFLAFARRVKHSKIPVYDGSIDKIVGIVQTKEIFWNQKKNFVEFIRPVNFIPGSKKIDDLLKAFDEQQAKLAIVVDEHGGTDGLLTLEDILEEIFGEIYDEFETPEHLVKKIDERHFRISGKAEIGEINEKLNLNIPEGEYDTFAGFILELLDKIPAEGEIVKFKNSTFVVEKMIGKRIKSVLAENRS